MKKKNIILLCVALIVVIICVLAVIIGYGSKAKNDLDDDEVESTEYKDSEDDEDSVDDESSEDKATEESGESMEENSSDETESDADMETEVIMDTGDSKETQTTQETSKDETVEEETTKEIETEVATTVPPKQETQKPLDRFSYEYMLIDGKTIYTEYNEKIMQLYESINAERRANGKPELMFDKKISFVACAMASQVVYKSCVDGGGEVLYYDMMKNMGISFTKTVENMAAGHTLAKDVVSGSYGSWKTSQKHYNNVISTDYTRVGVGVDYSESMGYVWVAIFSN